MNRNLKFRLYPSRNQEADLIQTLNGCRWLYNHMLQRKGEKWTNPDIQAEIPKLVKEHPFLGELHSKTRQYVLWQLKANLKALHELKKKGKRVGRLRFKGKGRFNCFVYNQTGFKLIETDTKQQRLHLSKIGGIPIRVHRRVEGNIKQVYVKRTKTGKWFAIFSVESETDKLQNNGRGIGIDLNIENYLTDSEGNVVKHPHTLRKLQKRLAREQKRMHKRKKGSNNRAKQRLRVARVHELIDNQRDDFLHRLSRYYVTNYDFIAVEDLSVKDMMQSSYNAINIADSAWSKFTAMLSYKAESAGRTFVKVDPKNTTQMCSRCGNYVYKQLWVRTHDCPSCGLRLDRDYNSALNVLYKARFEVGRVPSKLTPVETRPLLRNFGCGASFVAEAGSSFQKP